jgi:YVTN family beta-propeller protein
VIDSIAVAAAYDVAVSPDGSRIYVSQYDEGTLSVIDATTNDIVSTIAVSGSPYAIAVTPDGSRVYLTDFNGGVAVIDTATNTIAETLNVGGGQKWDIAITRDGSTAYVVQNNTVSQVSVIHIEAPPAITTPTLPDGVVGTPYAESVTATGFPAPTFTYTGTLPPGLALGSDGQLLGEPTTAGEYDFTVIATNEHGTDTQDYTITVEAPPTITTTPLPDGVVDDGYLANIVAIGTLPLTFTLDVPGTLPPGLGLTADGQVTGTPETAGDYTFSVTATNAHGTDTQSYTVSVGEPPSIAASPLPDGVVGAEYSTSISATGSPAPAYAVTGGSLPPGLDLADDGKLTGTPETSGDYDFTVTVTNAHGTVAADYSIHIAPPPAGLADTGTVYTVAIAIMALLILAIGAMGVALGIRRRRAAR